MGRPRNADVKVTIRSYWMTKGRSMFVATFRTIRWSVSLPADFARRTDGTGVAVGYGYDASGNLSGITDTSGSTQVFSARYGYNANNMVASDSFQPSGGGSYQYTTKSQLCYAAGSSSSPCSSAPSGAASYSYDPAGNLTGKNGNTQAFNSSDELCWGLAGSSSNSCGTAPSGATTYSYDANGNRAATTPASGSATAYSWNGASELTGYTVGSSTVGYGYSGSGLRQSRTAGGSTTQYTWNDSAAVATPLLLQTVTGGSTTSYVYGPTGAPLLEILPSGATYYYSGDNLDSTRVLTDASGAVVNSYTYSPYGRLSSSTGTVPNPLLYGGQYLDSGSGLYYLRARYYDPSTGQFLSIDPLVQVTLSPYAYVLGNPVNGVDPGGECGVDFLQACDPRCPASTQPLGPWQCSTAEGIKAILNKPALAIQPTRGFQYKSTGLGIGPVSLTLTRTRDGSTYLGPGFGPSVAPFWFSQRQGNVQRALGVKACESNSQIDSFISGGAVNINGYLIWGGGITVSSITSGDLRYAAEAGYGSPNIGASVDYNFRIGGP